MAFRQDFLCPCLVRWAFERRNHIDPGNVSRQLFFANCVVLVDVGLAASLFVYALLVAEAHTLCIALLTL